MRWMRTLAAVTMTTGVAAWAAGCGGDQSTGPDPIPPPPANRPPAAVGSLSAVTVDVGGEASVNVASNFSDPDGDALTYAASSSDAGVATASVAASTVTVVGVGAGSATVTVTARDPGGLSATQTLGVTVEAVNRAPEAVGTIEDVSMKVGDAVVQGLSSFFSDPDGDQLTFAATISDTTIATISVSGEAVTIDGVATGSGTVTVTATDPGGLSATQAFTATVEAANRAPEVVDTIPAQTVQSGGSATVDVSAAFSDPDGDELTFAASSSDTMVATVSVSGASVEIAAVAAGTATITVTATDPDGLAATQEVGVTVVAPPPEIADTIPTHDMIVDSMVPLDLSPYFGGGDLTYTVESSDEAVAVASVDGSTVTTTGTGAVEDSVSVAYLTVTASNAGGASALQDSIMVRVHREEYDTLPGLTISDEGVLTAQIGTTPFTLSICLQLYNFPVGGDIGTFTMYWSEWQRAVGGGWVAVKDNNKAHVVGRNPELEAGSICPIDIADDRFPPGVYRLAGHAKIGDETGFYKTATFEKKPPP